MLQGWTTPYDFSVADLRAAADVVAAAAASTGPNGPSWQQLLGLLQVIYGGRVSSRHDMKVCVCCWQQQQESSRQWVPAPHADTTYFFGSAAMMQYGLVMHCNIYSCCGFAAAESLLC